MSRRRRATHGPRTEPTAATPWPTVPQVSFVSRTLENGLVVVAHEDRAAPVVAVDLSFHVGSKDERTGRTGLAHLVEHLMFTGSEHCDTAWLRELERLGATDPNATTNADRTSFHQTVPAAALDTVLWMEADRMCHLQGALTAAKLERERAVVLNEKRQREDQPCGLVDAALAPVLYPAGHPYSWAGIGSAEDLRAITLDDVRQWLTNHYGAANACLVVAGDIDAEDLLQRAERYFGAAPAGPPLVRQARWIAKRTGERRLRLLDRVPHPRLVLTWNTPGWGEPDDDLLDLAARALGAGLPSRLHRRLVVGEALATAVKAGTGSAEIGSTFTLQIDVAPGRDPVAAERSLREELARYADGGPGVEELRRAKVDRMAWFVRSLERVAGRTEALTLGHLYGGRPDFHWTRLERVASATPAQVRDAVARWLCDGACLLQVDPLPARRTASSARPWPTRPPPGEGRAPGFPAFQRHVLSNGLTVLLSERHVFPLVELELLVDAGYATDPPDEAGTARMAAELLLHGTRARDAVRLHGALQALGATLTTRTDVDMSAICVSAPTASLDEALDVLADVVMHPAFPPDAFDQVRRGRFAGIAREAAEPASVASRLVARLVFGEGDARGDPPSGSGTAGSVRHISRDALIRWHATWVRPNNATLVAVGDASARDLVPRLERKLAGWTTAVLPGRGPSRGTPAARPGLFLLDRPGSQQSVVIAAQVVPPRAHPDELALRLVNHVLGGSAASRLNTNLREDKRWSYGAFSRILEARGPRLRAFRGRSSRRHAGARAGGRLLPSLGLQGRPTSRGWAWAWRCPSTGSRWSRTRASRRAWSRLVGRPPGAPGPCAGCSRRRTTRRRSPSSLGHPALHRQS